MILTTLKTLQENQFAHSGDKTTFYWSAGPSQGPLVIFVHGWPANGETWKPQLLALAALGFRVVAPDARGYGRSSVPEGPEAYAVKHHISDLLALLAHLGRDKAVWIGHDWGAAIVWGLAAMRPDKCAGVCCLAVPYRTLELGFDVMTRFVNRDLYPEDQSPLAQFDYQAFHNEQPEAAAAQLQANVPNTVKLLYHVGRAETYGKQAPFASVRKAGGWFWGAPEAPEVPLERTPFRDDKPMFDRLVAELERNGFEGPNGYYRNQEANRAYLEEAPNGARLRFPTLFVEARWDGICDSALSRMNEPMRALCDDLTEVSVEAGHWVAMEKPEEVNAALVRWIATRLPTYFPGYWKTPFVSSK